ncbi:MAG: MATE family efflux transporter [Candidatus Bipolaricaulota bacterium]
MRTEILTGPILKTMLTLGWPVMVTNSMQALYNLIDAFWLGRVSTEAVSAPSMAWPVLFFTISVAIGFQFAGTTLVAQHTGAGERERADKMGTQVFSFLFLVSLAMGLGGYGAAATILRLMNTPAVVFPLALQYLQIVSLGLPLMYGAFAFMGLLMGVGDTRTPMYLIGASVVANAVLDPLLIFGWGPFPELGVAGAAWATVSSRGLAALVGVWLLSSGRVGVRLRAKHIIPRWSSIRQILRVGTPNVVDQAGTSLGFVILMSLVAGFGTVAVAAYGVGNRLINLLNVAIMGASSSLLTMVGQNLGADQSERAEDIAHRGIRATTLTLVVLALLMVLLRTPLYRLFVPDPEVVAEGGRFLLLFSFSVPFFGLFAAASAVFRGSGHTVPPMVFSLLRLWAFRIGLAWVLGYIVGWGTSGLWTGMALSNVLGGVGLYGWLRRGTWKRKVIRSTPPPQPREAAAAGRDHR